MGVGNVGDFQKLFLQREERDGGPEKAKHRTSWGKSTDVSLKEVRCFCCPNKGIPVAVKYRDLKKLLLSAKPKDYTPNFPKDRSVSFGLSWTSPLCQKIDSWGGASDAAARIWFRSATG